VIGVQDEQHVEHAFEHGVGHVLPLGHAEQHAEEVARVAQVVVRVHVGQPAPVPVRVRGEGRDLRDQPVQLRAPRLLVEDVLGFRIEGRERGDGAGQDAHRMRVVAEAVDELADVLVHHRVIGDVAREGLELRAVGQLTVDQQVRGLEKARALGELLDRIAAVVQDALVAIDVRDAAAARRGVHERRVIGHQPEVVDRDLDLPQVGRAYRAVADRQLVTLAGTVVGDRQRVFAHARSV
jgi:hypothetical protein